LIISPLCDVLGNVEWEDISDSPPTIKSDGGNGGGCTATVSKNVAGSNPARAGIIKGGKYEIEQ